MEDPKVAQSCPTLCNTMGYRVHGTLQARLQQYVNRELPDVQAGFRKGRKPEIKLPTSAGSWRMQESFRKTSISTLLTMPKPLTVCITINCGKF